MGRNRLGKLLMQVSTRVHLRSLLFPIFINDIVDEVNFPIKLFADDTSIYAIVDNPLITSLSLNSNLQKVQNWSNRWLVNFNPKKTESMIISIQSSTLFQ